MKSHARIYNRITALFLALSLVITTGLSGCADIDEVNDGTYEVNVSLNGGSGKAYVESPCEVTVKDGNYTAKIIFSSPNYDYVIVDDEKYLPINDEGNSTFEIPIAGLESTIDIIADTTAMSEPHEIEYELVFGSDDTEETSEKKEEEATESKEQSTPPDIEGLTLTGETERIYAAGFSIYKYEDDYRIIDITGDAVYLTRLKGSVDDDIKGQAEDKGIIVLEELPDNIYLCATASMSLFDACDALNHIRFSSIKESKWTITSAKEAMEDGSIIFAGKYKEPDYELLVDEGCDLAIESTMILHTPSVAEKLEDLGIPVFIDRSGYEEHPLGRTEWVKVYGTLTDKEDEADDFFDEQQERFLSIEERINENPTDEKKIAFFYINSSGQIVTRKENDYIPSMIELAGGRYVPEGLTGDDEDSHSGTITISVEKFYGQAKDADILIYNGSITSSLSSIDELINMDSVFSDFNAVKNKEVYTNDDSLYQASDSSAVIIEDFYKMITNDNSLNFFKKLL